MHDKLAFKSKENYKSLGKKVPDFFVLEYVDKWICWEKQLMVQLLFLTNDVQQGEESRLMFRTFNHETSLQ